MQLDHRKMAHKPTPFLLNISLKCSSSRRSLKKLSWTGGKLVTTEGPTRKTRNALSLNTLAKTAGDEIIYLSNLFCLNRPQPEQDCSWQLSPGIVSCTWYAWSCKATSKVIFFYFVTDLTSVLSLFVFVAFMCDARRLPHDFVPMGCA